MQYKLTTPVAKEDLAPCGPGTPCSSPGTVYTARDAAHKRMMELLDAGEALPFPVEGSAVYYVGPTPERPGQIIGSAGPPPAAGWTPTPPACWTWGRPL